MVVVHTDSSENRVVSQIIGWINVYTALIAFISVTAWTASARYILPGSLSSHLMTGFINVCAVLNEVLHDIQMAIFFIMIMKKQLGLGNQGLEVIVIDRSCVCYCVCVFCGSEGDRSWETGESECKTEKQRTMQTNKGNVTMVQPEKEISINCYTSCISYITDNKSSIMGCIIVSVFLYTSSMQHCPQNKKSRLVAGWR